MSRLACRAVGDGPPVLLLHGFPLDGSMWEHQAAALAEAGFQAVVPDLPGHGASRVDHAATMEAMAAMALDCAPGPMAVAGFSMGGYVALALARTAPARVRGLALVSTRADADAPEVRQQRGAVIERLRKAGMSVLADVMLPKLLSEATRAARPELVDAVRNTIIRNPPDGAVAALEAMRDRRDQRDLLPQLDVPALVVVGHDDAVTPPAVAQAMAQDLPDARLVEVADAAHLVTMERPEPCSDALVAWAKRCR